MEFLVQSDSFFPPSATGQGKPNQALKHMEWNPGSSGEKEAVSEPEAKVTLQITDTYYVRLVKAA